MGKKKNKRSRPDIDSSEDIATSTPNTSGNPDIRKPVTTQVSLMTLSEEFAKMMNIMRETHSSVQSIEQRFIVVENRIKAIESEQLALRSEFSGIKSCTNAVENDISLLKNDNFNLQSEVKYFKEKTLCMSDRLMAAEYQPNENNLVVWNAVCEDEDQAKRMFTEICTDGLNLPVIPHFSVVAIKKDKKYFKVNVKNRGNKIEILKNGKKLKGRNIANQGNIYVSDDAPFSVREARKKLYEKKLCLKTMGIISWVSNTVPPYLQFERPGGTKVKFTCDEWIEELAHKPPPSTASRGAKK